MFVLDTEAQSDGERGTAPGNANPNFLGGGRPGDRDGDGRRFGRTVSRAAHFNISPLNHVADIM